MNCVCEESHAHMHVGMSGMRAMAGGLCPRWARPWVIERCPAVPSLLKSQLTWWAWYARIGAV